jgi:RHS repeat-associated protein
MAMAAELIENSHQGFERIKAGLCLASMEAKSNTASGMPVCLWQNGIRSRSSGKERDQETGLDYFGARYYSGAQGRFMSSDPKMISKQRLNDPQQWNMYAYTRNNPLQFVDPDGRETRLAQGANASIIVKALAHAYTKETFRKMFDTISTSKHICCFNNVDIPQPVNLDGGHPMVPAQIRPRRLDTEKELTKDNWKDTTIELDNGTFIGIGVADEARDRSLGHELDHGVEMDNDIVNAQKRHTDPQLQKI